MYFICLMQVYTRFHVFTSHSGTEAGVGRRLGVCIHPERVIALSRVASLCRDHPTTQLGTGALHHCLPLYEVSVGAVIKLFHA